MKGYSHEDIFEAIKLSWKKIIENLNQIEITSKLFQFRRILAVNSIGVSHDSAKLNNEASDKGYFTVKHGCITNITLTNNDAFEVHYDDKIEQYDYIINAIGRNIIQHPLWYNLFKDGLAQKHLIIGVNVNEHGQLIDKNGTDLIVFMFWMARSGDSYAASSILGNFCP